MKFVFADGQRGHGGKLLSVFTYFKSSYLAHTGRFIPVGKLVLRVFQDLSGLNVASAVLICVTTFSFHRQSWEDRVKGHHAVQAIKALSCAPASMRLG